MTSVAGITFSGQQLSEKAAEASTAVDIWSLFFTEEMLEIIVRCTNK
jgi:hypothetical protein